MSIAGRTKGPPDVPGLGAYAHGAKGISGHVLSSVKRSAPMRREMTEGSLHRKKEAAAVPLKLTKQKAVMPSLPQRQMTSPWLKMRPKVAGRQQTFPPHLALSIGGHLCLG